jgi:hypothetical protein
MKTRILLVLAMVLVLVVAGSASVAAKGATVPFRSTLATTPVVNGGGSGYFTLAIPGEGRSTHLGRTTWYADCTVYLPAPDPPLVQICTMTFYAANGDELYGETDGYAQLSGMDATFWGDFTITGGTGRFVNYTGSGTYEGTASNVPGSESGFISFDGTLTKP